MAVAWQGTEVPDPTLLALNDALAQALGLDAAALRTDDGVAILSGAASPAMLIRWRLPTRATSLADMHRFSATDEHCCSANSSTSTVIAWICS